MVKIHYQIINSLLEVEKLMIIIMTSIYFHYCCYFEWFEVELVLLLVILRELIMYFQGCLVKSLEYLIVFKVIQEMVLLV